MDWAGGLLRRAITCLGREILVMPLSTAVRTEFAFRKDWLVLDVKSIVSNNMWEHECGTDV
jgi:hypothetical protein